jgi:hypothetical protein
MNPSDPALRWGLPAGFRPVLYALPDEVKELVRGLLGANEPVVVALANQSDNIFLIATPQRLFSVRHGMGAGVTNFTVKEFAWDALTDLKMQQAPLNTKIMLSFHSRDGRNPESGPRAKQWKLVTDNLMPFDTEQGTNAFAALQSIWVHKTASIAGDEDLGL